MKKIIVMLFLFIATCNLNAQTSRGCISLDDSSLFVGDYYITTTDLDVLDFWTFNPGGEPIIVNLIYGGVSGERSFFAVYLPDADIGQPPALFDIDFNNLCEATLLVGGTGLQCGIGLNVGPAPGGFYDVTDDSAFTVVFTTNIDSDCGERPRIIEMQFTRDEPLSVAENTEFQNFSYFLTDEKVLNLSSIVPMDSFKIYNLLGQEILMNKLSSNNETIDLSVLKTGVYIVLVEINNIKKTIRIAVK